MFCGLPDFAFGPFKKGGVLAPWQAIKFSSALRTIIFCHDEIMDGVLVGFD